MKITIKKIAEEAGVSEATVSYVINDKGSVSREMRDQIKAIIKKRGYKPRKRVIPAAPGTKHGAIAIISPHSSFQGKTGELFISPLRAGIEETLAAAGLSASLHTATPDGNLPAACRKGAVDGVLSLWGSTSTNVPTVTVFEFRGRRITDLVQAHNHACGTMAVERLASLGCKQCAVLNPLGDHAVALNRAHVFLEALASHGIEAVSLKRGTNERASPVELVDGLLAEAPGVDGVFIPGSDFNTIGICMELQKRGKPPSDSLNVISCLSNIEYLGPLNLGIDFIDIQLHSVGNAAAETLLWRLQHKDAPYRSVLVRPRLIERQDASRDSVFLPQAPSFVI